MHSVNNQDRTWASPAATGPVRGRVRLPASKSITNRALVLAALGDGPAVIASPLQARDTTLAADALRALGCAVTPAARRSLSPERAGLSPPVSRFRAPRSAWTWGTPAP